MRFSFAIFFLFLHFGVGARGLYSDRSDQCEGQNARMSFDESSLSGEPMLNFQTDRMLLHLAGKDITIREDLQGSGLFVMAATNDPKIPITITFYASRPTDPTSEVFAYETSVQLSDGDQSHDVIVYPMKCVSFKVNFFK